MTWLTDVVAVSMTGEAPTTLTDSVTGPTVSRMLTTEVRATSTSTSRDWSPKPVRRASIR